MGPLERGTGWRRLTVAGSLSAAAVVVAVVGSVALWYAVGHVVATLAWTMLGGVFVLLLGAVPAWVAASVPPSVEGLVVGATVTGGVAATTWLLTGSIHATQRRLLGETRPPVDAERGHQATLDRLARQADTPAPELRIRDDDRPLCYTVRDQLGVVESPERGGDTYVVVTPALLDCLDDAETAAVLAHETAHVANGDLRLVNLLLVPVFWAERLRSQARAGAAAVARFDSVVEAVVGAVVAAVAGVVGGLLRPLATAGLLVFARGREYDADRGAAAITDDPVALATAVERLDGPDPQAADARETADAPAVTTTATTVVPPTQAGPLARLGGSHPPTVDRVQRLEAMASESSGLHR